MTNAWMNPKSTLSCRQPNVYILMNSSAKWWKTMKNTLYDISNIIMSTVSKSDRYIHIENWEMPAWKSYQCIEHWAHHYSFFMLYQKFTFVGNQPHHLTLASKDWEESLFKIHSSILVEFHLTIQFKIFFSYILNIYIIFSDQFWNFFWIICGSSVKKGKTSTNKSHLSLLFCLLDKLSIAGKRKTVYDFNFDTNLNAVWFHHQK